MKFFVLFITIFVLSTSCAYSSNWVYFYQDDEMLKSANDIVIYNALNLSENQRIDIREYNQDLKSILTRSQKPKYSMIKRLERQNKKRPRNPDKYYKFNPLLHQFGDVKTIEHCEEIPFILK